MTGLCPVFLDAVRQRVSDRWNPDGNQIELVSVEVGIIQEKKNTFDQENDQEKKKDFRLKNINQFYLEPLIIVSVIYRFDQIEYI